MKIYTHVDYVWDEDLQQYIEIASKSYEYTGPIQEAKGGGSQQTVQSTDPWSGQQPYLSDLFDLGQQWYYGGNVPTVSMDTSGAGPGGPIWSAMQKLGAQGTRTASSVQPGPDLTSTIDAYRSAQSTLDPYIQKLITANQHFASGNLLTPEANPALQDYLNMANRRIFDNYQQNVIPSIDYGALATENVGSSRHGVAQGLASQAAQTAGSDVTSQILMDAYGKGLQATLMAQNLAPQFANLAMINPELEKLITMMPENIALDRIKAYQSIVGGGGYGGTTTSTGPATESGGIAGALGGASVGAGLMTALESTNPAFAIGGAVLGAFS